MRNAIRCFVFWLACVVAACPAPSAAPATHTTIAARNASGDLILASRVGPDPTGGPRWLAALSEGDVLTYRVRSAHGATGLAHRRVVRLVRRGHGVAALLRTDSSSAFGLAQPAYWLAGDDEGLYRLPSDPELADPELVPLDGRGRVVADAGGGALWRVPRGWGEPTHQDDGWSAEELSLLVEGPVRGDRCLSLAQSRDTPTRIVVCASVGMVELRRGQRDAPQEHWRLVEIVRDAQTHFGE